MPLHACIYKAIHGCSLATVLSLASARIILFMRYTAFRNIP